MTKELQTTEPQELDPAIMQMVLTEGDLSKLTPAQLSQYYISYCNALNMNPVTRPFIPVTLNGKKMLYPGRECAAQLANRDQVTTTITKRFVENGIYFVECRAELPNKRSTESTGAVNVAIRDAHGTQTSLIIGEAYANAVKKAETQAKRRAILDLCGLGMPDEETELPAAPQPEYRPSISNEKKVYNLS